MKKNFSKQFIIVSILILIAAFSRLLTNAFHIWNFTPITAMALFSGAEIRNKKFAFLIPLSAMIITDVFLGFYQGILVVYVALLLITLLGFILQNRVNIISVVLASLGASAIFFIVTNFALFYPTMLYPHTWQGVIASYTAGIPFLKNAVIGDLLYSGILFGSYELILKKSLSTEKSF
jgi:hypothetical protein